MWAIWSSRNNYNHGETQYQPLRSMELVHEFIKSMDIPLPEEPAPLVEVAKWKRPIQGWVKINSDGAIDQHASLAGAGVVVRDSLGAFVAAECRKYDYIADPRIAELLACRDAVALAHSKGWSHVELETDCQAIVFAWDSLKDQLSAQYQIFREMKDYISNFQGFVFHFVRRDANKAAHVCARYALSLDSSSCMFDVNPGWLIEAVQSDLMSSME